MPLVYPKAEWTPSGVDGGAMLGGLPRCVWHTTETHPSAFFTAKTFYHMQIREWSGQVYIRQFIDFVRASRALRREDDVQTNRRGTYCPNVCIVGYAADSAGLSDAMVNEIGAFVDWAEQTMGVPPVFPLPFLGGEAYGYDGAARLTASQWTAFTGHCGHQHVYRNTHWDPGRFPVARILATLEEDLMAFTADEEKELKGFVAALKRVGSNGGFVEYLIPDIRKGIVTADELEARLATIAAGTVDEYARRQIEDLRRHLRES